mmetsp:Transcript_20557/g.20290  ORF Transcript_20557/g.20290 Transcript_20557/m.20290 type:complete len:96 (+) Transcript_20557:37-324(+)
MFCFPHNIQRRLQNRNLKESIKNNSPKLFSKAMKTVENGIVTSQNLKLAIKDLQRSGNAFMITKSVKTQRTKKPRKIQAEKRKSSSGRKLIKNMS